MFDAVQAQLDANNADRASGKNWKAPSLLTGVLYDTHGRKMTPGHATKRQRRCRYYLTHRIGVVPDGPPVERLPAHGIEGIVRDRLARLLNDEAALLDMFGTQTIEATAASARQLSNKLVLGGSDAKSVLQGLVERIDVRASEVAIALNKESSLGMALSPPTLSAPATKIRAGRQTRMVINAADQPPVTIDRKLVKLVAEAIAVRDMLTTGTAMSDAAAAIGSSVAYTARKARIGWLAPDIIAAILEGQQPATLTRRVLSQASNIPLDWNEQREALGFDALARAE